ncbi:unnamed protein product [Urochloa humidicola]
MERAVRSILVDCRYAEQGCTEKAAWPAYYDKGEHEKACPHAPRFVCPEPGCGFAGRSREELLDHLTGDHKWPSTTFRYWAAFDLCVAQPARGPKRAALPCERAAGCGAAWARRLRGYVPPHHKPTGFGCTVSFSCFGRHRSTWTLDDFGPLRISDWPPVEYICVVPKP